jgi:hypothetical protein
MPVCELKRMAEESVRLPLSVSLTNHTHTHAGNQPIHLGRNKRAQNTQALRGLLWEAVSSHDVSSEGHLKISVKVSLKSVSILVLPVPVGVHTGEVGQVVMLRRWPILPGDDC